MPYDYPTYGYDSGWSDGTGSSNSGNGSSQGNSSGGNSYESPSGGGGVTDSIEVNGKTINFGHRGRHLEGTGLDINEVNQAIANEVSKVHPGTGFYKGSINVEGTTIEYTSFGFGDGVINVGTYYRVP